MAKVGFLTQMLLTFGGRCNRHFWDIRLKILRLPLLICSFSLCWQKFSEVNCFRVYGKLITWSSHAKSLLVNMHPIKDTSIISPRGLSGYKRTLFFVVVLVAMQIFPSYFTLLQPESFLLLSRRERGWYLEKSKSRLAAGLYFFGKRYKGSRDWIVGKIKEQLAAALRFSSGFPLMQCVFIDFVLEALGTGLVPKCMLGDRKRLKHRLKHKCSVVCFAPERYINKRTTWFLAAHPEALCYMAFKPSIISLVPTLCDRWKGLRWLHASEPQKPELMDSPFV